MGGVIGYQDGTPNGFAAFQDNASITIDNYYVDGVSITHGAPGSRQHVWTFAAIQESGYCPCSYVSPQSTPPYVGNDYFCETGNDDNVHGFIARWYINDTLWDGQDCRGISACECTFNSSPRFCKQLPQATTDDIEVRLCTSQETDIPLENLEIYIH